MLNADNSIILIIDIQEKLVNMLESDTITQKATKLLKAANIFNIPAIITEQYPKGLGGTVLVIKQEAKPDNVLFEKINFSAMQEAGFKDLLRHFNRNSIILCGIETHVCVYQTARDLIIEGYDVEIVKDITASRKEFEYNMGIEKIKQLGAGITSFETVLFELLKTASHPNFKEIQSLVK